MKSLLFYDDIQKAWFLSVDGGPGLWIGTENEAVCETLSDGGMVEAEELFVFAKMLRHAGADLTEVRLRTRTENREVSISWIAQW